MRLPRSTRRIGAEVDEELEYHLAQRIAELERAGYEPAAARAEALRRFGDVGITRQVCIEADARREGRMRRHDQWADVWSDARIGLRQLRRRPGFALASILTLAVAIAFATAMYSVADHVLFRPLPFPNADRAVTLWQLDASSGEEQELAPGNFMDWRDRVTLFDQFAMAEPWSQDLTGSGTPESLPGWMVTPGWFEALGIQPIHGRLPDASEYGTNAAVVLLSHGVWQRRFGGDAAIVGSTIQLDNRATTVIGVLPAGLQYPMDDALIWLPRSGRDSDREDRRSDYMRGIALLKPGVTVAQAQAQLDEIAHWQAETYPSTNADTRAVVRALPEQVLGSMRPALLTLLGAVAFVLLIACGNVAGLLIARGAERRGELAVRAALGGSRARLTRQLLVESGVLALVSGALGIGLAALLLRAVPAIAPAELPRLDAVAIDARVALVAALMTALAALVFGMAPALRTSRVNVAGVLRGTRTQGERHGLRRVLIVTQFALALVLLTGAGLLGRSFARLLDNELGFDPQNRATFQVFAWDLNPTPQERIQFAARVLERYRAHPDVVEAGLTTALPVHPHAIVVHTNYRAPDEPVPAPGQEKKVRATAASTGYFEAMGMPLRAGRTVTDADALTAPPVMVVNESFARIMFPGANAVGQRVHVGSSAEAPAREIVGVVADTRPEGFDSAAEPEVFIPHGQSGGGSITFVVHTRRDPGPLMEALRGMIWAEQPRQAIYYEATLERMLATTIAERRFHLAMLGVFSLLALSLAAVGIYALISYATRQRFGEIGVRMALGARASEIARMIVSEGLWLALPGIGIGLIGSFALTRLMSGMLYGVSATDPVTFVQVSLGMLLVAALAAFIPARRAARLDPALTLRSEG